MTLQLEDEAQLQRAADQALLEEGHHLDIKRQLQPPPNGNHDLAVDLASFAIDGGQLVLGVDEDTSPVSLTPFEVAGVAERILQVGRSRVDEPLHVRTHIIDAVGRPGLGYVIVEIPPSSRPPHQVAGVYYARKDKTNYRMAAAEVARQHELREQWARSADELLRAFMSADPVGAPQREAGHLFVVAHAVAPPRDLLEPTLRGPQPWSKAREIIQATPARDEAVGNYIPGVYDARRHAPTAAGHAFYSDGFEDAMTVAESALEKDLIRVELLEAGGVRVFCGRGTVSRDRLPEGVLCEGLALAWCYRVIAIARAIADESDFRGSWDFGLGLNGVRGKCSESLSWSATSIAPFTEDEYVRTTRATAEEMEISPAAIVERLGGRLARALGSARVDTVAQLLQAHQD